MIKIIILLIIMYVIDFIIAPNIFKSQYPNNDGAALIYYGSIIGSAIIGMFMISNFLGYWIIGDIIYCLLIYLNHPKGIYGIGMSGIFDRKYREDTVLFHIFIQFAILLIIQIIISVLVKLIKFIKNNN
ncbi:MAG: hypothetical protein GX275_02985 [Clostridiales bacterium]|nr:hypothetical protein [Clostridiales bacterium]